MNSNTGSLAALVGVVLIGMTGFGIFLPIFPFLALKLHATPMSATLAMGAYSLGQLIASPFWGRLSDRVGRKPILIAGLLGSVVSYLWIARAGSVADLGAARLFGGLMAGNIGAAFASAADLSTDATRVRNMGLLGAAVGLAFIAGPALGALFISGEPSLHAFTQVCTISAALAGLAGFTALVLFRETLTPQSRAQVGSDRPRRHKMLASRPLLLRLLAVMLLAITAQALMETTFALWANVKLSWGPQEVGYTLALLGVGAALLQGGVAGRAARVLGERTTLLVGLALLATGLGVLSITHEVSMLSLSLAALVTGIGLATPALNALLAEQATEQERGAVMGLSQSASAFGRVAGPACAGVLFETFGAGSPFLAASVVCLTALAVTLGSQTKSALDARGAASLKQ